MSNLLNISKELSDKELRQRIEDSSLEETLELLRSRDVRILKVITNEKA